jgi:hypothetical protein
MIAAAVCAEDDALTMARRYDVSLTTDGTG